MGIVKIIFIILLISVIAIILFYYFKTSGQRQLKKEVKKAWERVQEHKAKGLEYVDESGKMDKIMQDFQKHEEKEKQRIKEILKKEAQLRAEAKVAEEQGTATMPTVSVCDRTKAIKKTILEKVEKTDCSKVTVQDLKSIIDFNLRESNIKEFKIDDFSDLTSMERVYFYDAQLKKWTEGAFSNLPSLKAVYVDVLDIYSLPKEEENRMRKDLGDKLLTNEPVGEGETIEIKIKQKK